MPRNHTIAAHRVNSFTTLKTIQTFVTVPTDEEFFRDSFAIYDTLYGVVLYESHDSRKIFVLNLDLPQLLNDYLTKYNRKEIDLSELIILFHEYIDFP
jgi:hypothetical protein